MTAIEQTCLDLAKGYEKIENYEKALAYYRKISSSPEVFEIIGEYLYLGKGCTKNRDGAREYFEKAAASGNTDAMCNAALCCDNAKDKLDYYEKAAVKGIPYAMNMMGLIIKASGLRPEEESVRWFKKAADEGEAAGQCNYSFLADDPAEKIRYLKMAVDQSYKPAMLLYAQYLEEGKYVERNTSLANEIREKAANVHK